MSRMVKFKDADRTFDIEFWQRQGDAAILAAAWEIVVFANKLKGRDASELHFKEHLRNYNDHNVRYLVVGAYAVMKYTEPRYTKDLDIWVDPSQQDLLDAKLLDHSKQMDLPNKEKES